MQSTLLIGGLLFAVLALSSIPEPAVPQVSERCDAQVCYVKITRDGFVPKTIIIKIGTTIVWTNTDEGRHTVTSGSPGEIKAPLRSKLLEKK
ncbi:MAG: hypothetical protein QXU32_07005 [Nitrososphaerales archaeon]